jgi:hypothetical protein
LYYDKMLSMAQYGDLPQIVSMDEPRYPVWGAEHYSYEHSYRQQDMHFSPEDELRFGDFENGTMGVQSLERFMHDQYSIPQSVLFAKNPVERLPVDRYDQWHTADCYRHVSPDRTSASSSNDTQNELQSPLIFRRAPYGNPTEALSQPALPYPMHSKDFDYLPTPPHVGGSISLRQLEYEHHEHHELESEPAMEDIEVIDMKQEVACEDHVADKMDTTTSDTSGEYADSGIGASPRDAEEVVPIDEDPEDPHSDSDCEYTPTSKKSSKRRRSSASSGSPKSPTKRTSISKPANTNKVTKRARPVSSATKKQVETDDDRRPFPCPLATYGCNSTFASKNEWKRHVNTQHIKLGFWRCDICPPTTDPNDNQTFYYNDFNRKDLFTQHLRRMHAASKDSNPEHQTRCLQSLRSPPPQSICLFCDRTFEGPSSWEERMEHVGRHLEKDKNTTVDMLDIKSWNKDESLEKYLLNEGLVVYEHDGWKVGDGKPRRPDADDSGDEHW